MIHPEDCLWKDWCRTYEGAASLRIKEDWIRKVMSHPDWWHTKACLNVLTRELKDSKYISEALHICLSNKVASNSGFISLQQYRRYCLLISVLSWNVVNWTTTKCSIDKRKEDKNSVRSYICWSGKNSTMINRGTVPSCKEITARTLITRHILEIKPPKRITYSLIIWEFVVFKIRKYKNPHEREVQNYTV